MAFRKRSQTTDLAYKMANFAAGEVCFTARGATPGKGELRGDDAIVAQFVETVARDLNASVALSVCERLPASGAFRFFLDMQCADLTPGGLDPTLYHLASEVIRLLRVQFFGLIDEAHFEGLICLSKQQDSAGGLVRLVFPNLFVDCTRAIFIRQTLETEFHRLPVHIKEVLIGDPMPVEHNTRLPEMQAGGVYDGRWAQCLQGKVYIEDGEDPVLFGTHPARSCPGMDGKGCKKRSACSVCQRDGFVLSGEQLTLWGCFDAQGHPDVATKNELKDSWETLLKRAMLRVPSTQTLTEGWSTPEGASQVAIRTRPNRSPSLAPNFPVERKRRAGVLMTDDFKLCLLLRAIRRFAEGRYANVMINKVYWNQSANSYLVFVRGSGSSYCLFKRGDHDDDLIYFVVNRDGIAQHCPCCSVQPKAKPVQLSESGKRVLNLPHTSHVGGDFITQLREKILPALDAFRHGHVDTVDLSGDSGTKRRRR